MSDLPAPLEEIARLLIRWPGIGRRSAERIAFHLARTHEDDLTALAQAIGTLSETLHPCSRCGNLATESLCDICLDERRDASLVCVIEQPENLAAIERTGAYRGRYHVLGGAIAPLKQVGPDDLRIDQLLARLESEPVEEIILATNPTLEGEATALYLARLLGERNLVVTRPATGIPPGGELEYVDRATLARALEARRKIDES